MTRQVQWRRSSSEEATWLCKTESHWRNSIKLRLSIEAGVHSNICNRNAKLKVMKQIPGTREKEIILIKEFPNAWAAKETVDSLLVICYQLFNSKENQAEEKFISILSEYSGAPMPEQPDLTVMSPRIYNYYR